MRDVLTMTPVVAETSATKPAHLVGEHGAAIASLSEEAVYGSSSSEYDVEKQASSVATSDFIHDHVDVQYAEKQFADLKRRYSNLSRVASATSTRSKRRPLSRGGEKTARADEGVFESDDEFDLEDVLRDRHKKEVEGGIKPKHLGNFQFGLC